MQIFKVNDRISIICQALNTRNGFKHEAQLMINGREYGNKAKICYINRTWEKFTYESVIHKLIEQTDALTKESKQQFNKELNDKYGY